MVGSGLGRPGRRDEQYGQLLEALCQEHQPAQRRGVGPVQVVRHQQQRLLRGEAGDHRQQPLQRAEEAGLGACLPIIGAEHGRSGLGSAGHELRPLRHLTLEELAHQAECERAVELGPAAAKDAQPGRLAERGDRAQQLRLADPGLPLDDHEPAVAGALDQSAHPIELALALQQFPRGDRRLNHCRTGRRDDRGGAEYDKGGVRDDDHEGSCRASCARSAAPLRKGSCQTTLPGAGPPAHRGKHVFVGTGSRTCAAVLRVSPWVPGANPGTDRLATHAVRMPTLCLDPSDERSRPSASTSRRL